VANMAVDVTAMLLHGTTGCKPATACTLKRTLFVIHTE
jgi:hypothetical protein